MKRVGARQWWRYRGRYESRPTGVTWNRNSLASHNTVYHYSSIFPLRVGLEMWDCTNFWWDDSAARVAPKRLRHVWDSPFDGLSFFVVLYWTPPLFDNLCQPATFQAHSFQHDMQLVFVVMLLMFTWWSHAVPKFTISSDLGDWRICPAQCSCSSLWLFHRSCLKRSEHFAHLVLLEFFQFLHLPPIRRPGLTGLK